MNIYIQYFIIFIFSLSGIAGGIYIGFQIAEQTLKTRKAPAKIKRYIPEPKSYRETNDTVEEEDTKEDSKHNNRILERLRSEDDISYEEMLGLPDDERVKHIEARMQKETAAYTTLKRLNCQEGH